MLLFQRENELQCGGESEEIRRVGRTCRRKNGKQNRVRDGSSMVTRASTSTMTTTTTTRLLSVGRVSTAPRETEPIDDDDDGPSNASANGPVRPACRPTGQSDGRTDRRADGRTESHSTNFIQQSASHPFHDANINGCDYVFVVINIFRLHSGFSLGVLGPRRRRFETTNDGRAGGRTDGRADVWEGRPSERRTEQSATLSPRSGQATAAPRPSFQLSRRLRRGRRFHLKFELMATSTTTTTVHLMLSATKSLSVTTTTTSLATTRRRR